MKLLQWPLSLFLILLLAPLLVSNASAPPSITFHSPINGTTYLTDGVVLDVASNEAADFYLRGSNGRPIYLARDTTSFKSTLYQKAGTYTLTIWANSSTGISSTTVTYISTKQNPVNITECGILVSHNTDFRLQNDISGSGCLLVFVNNASVDFNGFTVSGFAPVSIQTANSRLFNGTIRGTRLLDLSVSFFTTYRDLVIRGDGDSTGLIFFGDVQNNLFENIFVNTSTGIRGAAAPFFGNVFRNVNLTCCGESASAGAGFELEFYEIGNIYENVRVDSRFKPDHSCDILVTCHLTLRNSQIDTNDMKGLLETVAVFQEAVDISVKDQLGAGIPAKLEVLDNGVFPRDELSAMGNPTSNFSASTDDAGKARLFLTKNVTRIVFNSESAGANNETRSFSPYNIWARGRKILDQKTVSLPSLPVNFTLPIPFCDRKIIRENAAVEYNKTQPCLFDELTEVLNVTRSEQRNITKIEGFVNLSSSIKLENLTLFVFAPFNILQATVEINTTPHTDFSFRENILEIRNVTVGSTIIVHYKAMGKPLFGVFLEACEDLEGPVDYVLKKNIKANRTPCFAGNGIENMTLDLNGFEINGVGGEAISIKNSKTIEIFNGKIRNSSNAIFSQNSLNITLKDLQLTNSTFGIFFDRTNSSAINSVNASFNSQDGARIENSNDTIVTGIIAFNNTNGVHFRFSLFNNVSFGNNASFNSNDGIKLVASNVSNITNNSATFNVKVGLHITSSIDYVKKNNILDNTNGFNLIIDPSKNIISTSNRFLNALVGLEILDSSDMTFTDEFLANNNNSIVLNNSRNITFVGLNVLNSSFFDIILINSNATIIDSQINVTKVLLIGNSNLFGLEVEANVEIEPETINIKSKGQFITAFIEVPSFNVSQIAITSVRLNGTIPAISGPRFGFIRSPEVSDRDGDGSPEIMVKFDRGQVNDLLTKNGPTTLTITGNIGPAQFRGSDTIRAFGNPPFSGMVIAITRWIDIIGWWVRGLF